MPPSKKTIVTVSVLLIVAAASGYYVGSRNIATTTITVSGVRFYLMFNQVSRCPNLGYLAPWRVSLSDGEVASAFPPYTNDTECCSASPTNPPTITFHVPNGNYTYEVSPSNELSPANGSVAVNGQNATVELSQEIASCGSTTATGG